MNKRDEQAQRKLQKHIEYITRYGRISSFRKNNSKQSLIDYYNRCIRQAQRTISKMEKQLKGMEDGTLKFNCVGCSKRKPYKDGCFFVTAYGKYESGYKYRDDEVFLDNIGKVCSEECYNLVVLRYS